MNPGRNFHEIREPFTLALWRAITLWADRRAAGDGLGQSEASLEVESLAQDLFDAGRAAAREVRAQVIITEALEDLQSRGLHLRDNQGWPLGEQGYVDIVAWVLGEARKREEGSSKPASGRQAHLDFGPDRSGGGRGGVVTATQLLSA